MNTRALLCTLVAAVHLTLSIPSQSETTSQVGVAARLDPDGIQRTTIIGGEYFFEPQRLTVKMNVPVELELRKEKSVIPPHFCHTCARSGHHD